ncbi:MAG: Lrp/AsnC family transcriptional regulator [Alphaproteobacteria bacterium]|nr:Lrp/AsnC family transcriptional regulator [Alphaproteobacteria bacterium]
MAAPYKLDQIDLKILDSLQSDYTTPTKIIAQQLNIPESSCAKRVRLLKENGYIQGVYARVNEKKLSSHIVVLIDVVLMHLTTDVYQQFSREIIQHDCVRGCYMMTGKVDFTLRVVVSKIEDLTHFITKVLTPMPTVRNIRTKMIIDTIKDDHRLPLE